MKSNLIAALAAINLTELKSPSHQIGENQILAGTLPEELIRLFALRRIKAEAFEAAVAARKASMREGGELFELRKAHYERHHQADFDPAECDTHHNELRTKAAAIDKAIEEAKAEAQAVDELFWLSVKLEFGLTSSKGIYLGENWSVFGEKEKAPSETPEISVEVVDLGEIFGAGFPFDSPGFPGFGGGFPGGFPDSLGDLFGASGFPLGGIEFHIIDLSSRRPSRRSSVRRPRADDPAPAGSSTGGASDGVPAKDAGQ